MKITDKINSLLEKGVATITFGISPKRTPFIQADQWVRTGGEGNNMRITHQADCETMGQCLDKITEQVEHASKIESAPAIVQVRNGN